jgi:hypothetical protein
MFYRVTELSGAVVLAVVLTVNLKKLASTQRLMSGIFNQQVILLLSLDGGKKILNLMLEFTVKSLALWSLILTLALVVLNRLQNLKKL